MKRIDNPVCTVVLCTYNGEAYLDEQLDSILAQTRRPDLVVIGDDGSTDGTLDLLADFRSDAPFPVVIHRGKKRPVGPSENFSRTLERSAGDWFALCDQDDIWHANKLECLEAALMADVDVHLAFSDANLVGPTLSDIGKTFWQRVGLNADTQMRLSGDGALVELLKRYTVMGAAMAFSSDLCAKALPIPPGWPHDAWIATIAAAAGRLAPVSEPLLDYRQHGNNAVGGLRPSRIRQIRDGLQSDRLAYLSGEIARHRQLLRRLENLTSLDAGRSPPLTAISQVTAKLSHLVRRESLTNFPPFRWPQVIKDWRDGKYQRWTTDWRSLALDLFIPNRH